MEEDDSLPPFPSLLNDEICRLPSPPPLPRPPLIQDLMSGTFFIFCPFDTRFTFQPLRFETVNYDVTFPPLDNQVR